MCQIKHVIDYYYRFEQISNNKCLYEALIQVFRLQLAKSTYLYKLLLLYYAAHISKAFHNINT